MADRLIHQYVTKGGAVIDSPVDQAQTLETAANVASDLLEMDDKTVLIITSVTGGRVAVRVDQLDHIATEPLQDQDA